MAKSKRNGSTRARRGSPAKKTVDKADTVETRRVEASQKSLIDGNRLLQHIATVEGYNGKIETLKGSLRNQMKVIKADGINPKTVTNLIAIKRADPLEYREYLEQLGVGFKAIGLPFQLSVFDVAFESPVKQAEIEGAAQGRAGRAAEPTRYAEGSPEHKAYMDKYSEEQAKNVPGADQLSEAERRQAVEDASFTQTGAVN